MPFTISHTIVAFPLLKISKGKLSLSGLIVGSVMPDLEYYFRMEMYGIYGHNPYIILPVGLLVGFVILAFFHLVIRDTLIMYLPKFIQRKYSHHKDFDWFAFAKTHKLQIAISILIGIISHLLWDLISHGPEYLPFIGNTILMKKICGFYMHELVFWLSSILGLVGLLVLFFRTEDNQISKSSKSIHKTTFWIIWISIAMTCFALKYISGVPDFKIYIQYLVVSMSSIGIATCLTCLIFKVYSLR